MKKLIAATLLFIVSPFAMASSTGAWWNDYNVKFGVYADQTLPPLKILSITTPGKQPLLTSAKLVSDTTLEIKGFKEYLYGCDSNVGTPDECASSGNVDVYIRVGYDSAHYTDVLIHIHKPFIGSIKTTIIGYNPTSHGVQMMFPMTKSVETGSLAMMFTKTRD